MYKRRKFTMHYWFIPKTSSSKKAIRMERRKSITFPQNSWSVNYYPTTWSIWDLWWCCCILKREWKSHRWHRRSWTGTISWKRWSWTSGSMLPGFHRNSRSSGRRYWSELSSGSFQTALWEQTSEGNSEPMDWRTQLAHTCRCFLYCTVPRILTEIFPVRYRRCRLQ